MSKLNSFGNQISLYFQVCIVCAFVKSLKILHKLSARNYVKSRVTDMFTQAVDSRNLLLGCQLRKSAIILSAVSR